MTPLPLPRIASWSAKTWLICSHAHFLLNLSMVRRASLTILAIVNALTGLWRGDHDETHAVAHDGVLAFADDRFVTTC
jgi:hypothetical protein